MEIYDSRFFRINKTMLSYIGLWPYQSRKKKLFRRINYMVIVAIMAMPHLIGIYKHFGVDFDRFLEHVGVLIYIFTIFLKIITTIFSEAKLQVLYDNIKKNWQTINEENEKNKLIHYSERGKMLTIGYITYITSALISFVTLPLFPFILDFVKPLNESRPHIFVLNGEFIIDRDEHYGKLYIFDLITCCVSASVIMAVDTMYVASIEHCLGLFAIAKLRLRMPNKLVYNEDCSKSDDSYKYVIGIVQLHKKILQFTAGLETSYSLTFFFIMIINILYFSILSLFVLINLHRPVNFIRYLMLTVGITIHLFYISWPGQKLIDHSSALFHDAYFNEWYESSNRTKKILTFFKLRCQQPCTLTAGGLYTMNFQNFLLIMKTSISYITVLASFR